MSQSTVPPSSNTCARYLEAVLAHVSDAVAIIDGNGRLRYASPHLSEVVGFDPLDLVGRRALAFVHPDDRPAVLRMFSALDGGKEAERKAIARIPQSTGGLGVYQLCASRIAGPVEDAGIIVSMRDVTERHRLESELSRVQRLESIGRLAGAVAHDFNNLLTAIRSYAVFAREALASGDSADDDLREILSSTDRGETLTRQLLAFARRQVHEPRHLDLGQLVKEASRLLERLAGERYQLTIEVQPGVWPVHADPAQIEQCLVNLVVNAVEAMPEGGAIDIVVANIPEGYEDEVDPLPAECVSLCVRDSGPGLCPQARQHLFEPFFTTKSPGKGDGLGLAVVYGVVRKHGGRVVVDTAAGKGTSVSLLLPRAFPAGNVSRPVSFGPRAPMVGIALVVEDDDLVRSVVSRALVTAGLVVHECSTGHQALAIAAQLGDELDVVVTDVVMPHMDGPTLARQLRRQAPNLPVLFITGYSEDSANLVSMLGQRDRLLRKPFSIGGLIEALGDLLVPSQH